MTAGQTTTSGTPAAARATDQGAGDVVCQAVTKDFGRHRALDGVSFTARMGEVTGFVGANGAGKTTTMRIALGLVAPTSGQVLVAGHRYADLDRPRHVVGAVLERLGAHPGQTAVAYLRVIAAGAGIADTRVAEVLDLVGLADDGRRRLGGFSLGMRQRLALAAALLGDPQILVLDEPANGLDPLGIRWTRSFLRQLADDGRCVLVSSHQLGELEAVADRIVMIHRGRLIGDSTTDDPFAERARTVTVGTREPHRLQALITEAGGVATPVGNAELVVRGLTAERVGEIASASAVPLSSLVEGRTGLEDLFLALAEPDGPTTSTGGVA